MRGRHNNTLDGPERLRTNRRSLHHRHIATAAAKANPRSSCHPFTLYKCDSVKAILR